MELTELQKKWVGLLENPIDPKTKKPFSQYTNCLASDDLTSFCCLGVVRFHVLGDNDKDCAGDGTLYRDDVYKKINLKGAQGLLEKPSPSDLELIKNKNKKLFSLVKGKLPEENLLTLAYLNDGGISFKLIAWFIKTFPHLVFTSEV